MLNYNKIVLQDINKLSARIDRFRKLSLIGRHKILLMLMLELLKMKYIKYHRKTKTMPNKQIFKFQYYFY